jgi:hypothetical protein
VQRGVVLSTVCKQFGRVVGSCTSSNWTALEYGAPPHKKSCPRSFEELRTVLDQRPYVTSLSASVGDLKVCSSKLQHYCVHLLDNNTMGPV